MKVSQEARSRAVATTPRRSHGAAHDRVHDVDPGLLLEVVVATAINELPQQFNRRLGAIRLDLGHVHVVDEDDGRLAHVLY